MSKVIEDIIARAQQNVKTIVLAEGEEPRTVAASQVIAAKGIAKLILLGDEAKIKDMYPNFKSKNITIVNPLAGDNEDYINEYYELRKAKGMTMEQARLNMKNPLFYGAMMVRKGVADGMVAGAINATGNVLRAGLQIIKTAPGIRTVSSCFIMCLDETHMKDRHVMVFGDSAVNIAPTAQQLADIAVASAQTARLMAGIEPRIAMLSFSTKGSAKHERVDKVRAALEEIKTREPNLLVDGELQLDAAVEPEVARLKAPGSPVAGNANVFVFPSLEAGNIGYKIAQRFGGWTALGPLLQGFAHGWHDLSRGCSSDDIYKISVVGLGMNRGGQQ